MLPALVVPPEGCCGRLAGIANPHQSAGWMKNHSPYIISSDFSLERAKIQMLARGLNEPVHDHTPQQSDAETCHGVCINVCEEMPLYIGQLQARC